jgi:IPT/TIG domain
MSLAQRHIGRRVAGVGVAVALMVLGLQAPANATVTITALSPTSGPADCVVVATGTGFKDFPSTQIDVDFLTGTPAVATPAADFFVISDTILWVTVPALTTGSSYTLRVTNPANTPTGVSSTATFLSTTGAGGCAPTIASFTPTCGSSSLGTTVVITGTNLINSDLAGAEVRFSPYNASNVALHVLPDVDDVTVLNVIVPSGGATPTGDGPIKVTTDVASVFSATSFLVPPPDCLPVTPPAHARKITLKLKDKLKASGVVSSTEDPAFTDCVSGVPVKIQRKTSSGWKNVGSTTTSDTGSYSKAIKNKSGKYRAIAKKVSLGDPVTDVCSKATSAVAKH